MTFGCLYARAARIIAIRYSFGWEMKKVSVFALLRLMAMACSAQSRESKKAEKNQPETKPATSAPTSATPVVDADKDKEKDKKEEGLHYRNVGPFRGGRSLTGVGVPGNPNIYYFGATGGGVWKSVDSGVSWSSVFDKEGTGDIGSIAVAESDPNIVYVGTGEACIRGNISHG